MELQNLEVLKVFIEELLEFMRAFNTESYRSHLRMGSFLTPHVNSWPSVQPQSCGWNIHPSDPHFCNPPRKNHGVCRPPQSSLFPQPKCCFIMKQQTPLVSVELVSLLTFLKNKVSLECFSQNEGHLSLRCSDSVRITTACGPPGQDFDFYLVMFLKISGKLG